MNSKTVKFSYNCTIQQTISTNWINAQVAKVRLSFGAAGQQPYRIESMVIVGLPWLNDMGRPREIEKSNCHQEQIKT